MLLNLSSFSQIGTQKIIDDSVVVLKKSVAKKIAKDLIKYDALIKIDSIKTENISLLQKQILIKDSAIVKLKRISDLQYDSYLNASSRYGLLNELYVAEKRKNKKQKFKTTLSQIGLSALVVFLVIRK
jgi:hypothetical protein